MGWAAGLTGFLKKAGGGLFSRAVKAGGVVEANLGARKFRQGLGVFGANFGIQTAIGAAATGVTGDASFLLSGMAMGAVGGGASLTRAPGAGKLLWAKRMGIGQGIGALTGSAIMGPVAALGWGGAKMLGPLIGKGMSGGALHAPGYALNAMRAPFAPGAAFRSLARNPYPAGAPFMLGLAGGGGWAATKASSGRSRQDALEGIFMGGTSYAAPGGRTMGFNHLETAGLTLAIHNRGRGSRVMM